MHILNLLNEEVERLRDFLGVEPARGLPETVELIDSGPEVHATSSLRAGRLLLSRSLDKILDKVIKKEALSLFIPKEADSVPQVHDLSWVHAGVDDSIWEPLRRDPPGKTASRRS
ncbi:MAG: hypothetical protein NZ992_08655 [Candidatus Korarchaeum sp.]|nr:hypothetical protein [Candidatus Korarchaeum sp.]